MTPWIPGGQALLLAAWAACEVAAARRAARAGPQPGLLRLSVWSLRPWALWALLGLLCRRYGWARFGHSRTFPLYAHPWRPEAAWWQVLGEWVRLPDFWAWLAGVLLLAAGLLGLARRLASGPAPSPRRAGLLALLLAVLAFALWSGVACLPRGARVRGPRDPGSHLLAWHRPASTFLYAMPRIVNVGDFMRRFAEIQPRLRDTIHGITHPPGAALSLHAVGSLTGATGRDIRLDDTKRRYALGLTAAAALNVLAVFLLGWQIFGCTRTGLLTALLWLVSPAATAYTTFSQDPIYAILFHLSLPLAWRAVAGAERGRLVWGVAWGAVMALLAWMTFSWCIAAALFAGFAAWRVRRQERGSWPDLLRRAVPPLAAMTLLGALPALAWRIDYLALYRVARDYHERWYRLAGGGEWVLALVGGQLDLWLMSGALAAAWAWRGVRAAASAADGVVRARRAFLAVLLAVYALPVLLGPSPLKLETSRCWIWVPALPLAFAAQALLRAARPAVCAAAAVGVSLAGSVVLRLFMDFGI